MMLRSSTFAAVLLLAWGGVEAKPLIVQCDGCGSAERASLALISSDQPGLRQHAPLVYVGDALSGELYAFNVERERESSGDVWWTWESQPSAAEANAWSQYASALRSKPNTALSLPSTANAPVDSAWDVAMPGADRNNFIAWMQNNNNWAWTSARNWWGSWQVSANYLVALFTPSAVSPHQQVNIAIVMPDSTQIVLVYDLAQGKLLFDKAIDSTGATISEAGDNSPLTRLDHWLDPEIRSRPDVSSGANWFFHHFGIIAAHRGAKGIACVSAGGGAPTCQVSPLGF